MGRTRGLSLARHYLRAHLWFHHRRDRLTVRQRKLIIFSLSFVYSVCSIWIMAQFFLPHEEGRLPILKRMITDSDIYTDSVFIQLYQRYPTSSNENG